MKVPGKLILGRLKFIIQFKLMNTIRSSYINVDDDEFVCPLTLKITTTKLYETRSILKIFVYEFHTLFRFSRLYFVYVIYSQTR